MKTLFILLLSVLVYTANGVDIYGDTVENPVLIDGTDQMLTAEAGAVDHSTMTLGSLLTVTFSGNISMDMGMTRSIKLFMSGVEVASSGDINFDPSTYVSGNFPTGAYRYECVLKFKVRGIDSGASTITYSLYYGSFLHTKSDSLSTNTFAFDTTTFTIDSTLTSIYPTIQMDEVTGTPVIVVNKMFDIDR